MPSVLEYACIISERTHLKNITGKASGERTGRLLIPMGD
jgi:hypothetical protein